MSTYSHVPTELQREPAARMNALFAPLETVTSPPVEASSGIKDSTTAEGGGGVT